MDKILQEKWKLQAERQSNRRTKTNKGTGKTNKRAANGDRHIKKSNGGDAKTLSVEAKRSIITELSAKYSISRLCKHLGINRNVYYYEPKSGRADESLRKIVKDEFINNKRVYGQKKLYKSLRKKGVSIGKVRLARIVKEEGLVSKYNQRRKRKNENESVNNDEIENKLNRDFNGKKTLEVVVSDLTYIDINKNWHYICLLIELSHREIIGFSAGKNKDAELVKNAWLSVKKDIRDICIFHTDRGGEFKNDEIDRILGIANIERSLSRSGNPIDNAVSESMYDIVKTEFVYGERFSDLADLRLKLASWVWWYNNERIHSSLGYKTPVESRESCEIGVTDQSIANKKYQKFWKKVSFHNQKVLIDKKNQK